MLNDNRAAIREKAATLETAFRNAGALHVESDALLPADTLLDLYGEDIRARAYVTQDPVLGERMLRPDFTVPIVERHMSEGAEPARYCYNGSVWRKQDAGSQKASEFIQVGFELFDRTDPAVADAEVFALFREILPDDLTVGTGDIGILRAAIAGLTTSDKRRAALLRHSWRPTRFRQLLDRFGGKTAPIASRVDLIKAAKTDGIDTLIKSSGKFLGLRSKAEVHARIESLINDVNEPSLPSGELAVIEAILNLDCTAIQAVKKLHELQSDLPAIAGAIAVFETRLAALSKHGVDVDTLAFEGSYGLTSMEYYDGFVFGFQRGEQVIASGGRYDALTSVLGNGRDIAAVGGVIRPDLLLGVA
ncbi:ATP phosphoribosyltransferase regulatory subunit [Amylibacter ulvae]|uniref:ATP phosphoribosyltransferase regulatory subunit n=1 Tax=Paramylibacter ulvae TaxID=1651968 RepID=A0ABQ3D0B1_9RHOB|nr:ATP phosphoribosyltransferase regulatory subunit [Amylibacter ulvae]GHA45059.1 ATP phosphoribosyltransferase regulatory subunit [Amylibacter ulvae]